MEPKLLKVFFHTWFRVKGFGVWGSGFRGIGFKGFRFRPSEQPRKYLTPHTLNPIWTFEVAARGFSVKLLS